MHKTEFRVINKIPTSPRPEGARLSKEKCKVIAKHFGVGITHIIALTRD